MNLTAAVYPEFVSAAKVQVGAGQVTWRRVLAVLFSRALLFAGFQALIAGIFALFGDPHPWATSIGWWPVTAILTNFINLGLLANLFRAEGDNFRRIMLVDRRQPGWDVLTVLGLFVVTLPFTALPNILVARWLWGDAQAPANIMFQPLPFWAAWTSLLLFPLTVALVELPLYYRYVMPRLEALFGSRWPAIALTIFMHAAQHCCLPLVFDGRFLVWRLLMFFPLACLLAVCVRWRPRLMPYLMIIHGLLDFTAVWMVFSLTK